MNMIEVGEIPEIVVKPCEWVVLEEFYPAYGRVSGGIKIVERKQRDGSTLYAVVMRDKFVLSRYGDWHFEPLPSSRSDEFLKDHRFSFDEAKKRAVKIAETIIEDINEERS